MVKKPSPLITRLERKGIHVLLLMTCILLSEGVTGSYAMEKVCPIYATCVASIGSRTTCLCTTYSRWRLDSEPARSGSVWRYYSFRVPPGAGRATSPSLSIVTWT
jgi:hypothetical protein